MPARETIMTTDAKIPAIASAPLAGIAPVGTGGSPEAADAAGGFAALIGASQQAPSAECVVAAEAVSPTEALVPATPAASSPDAAGTAQPSIKAAPAPTLPMMNAQQGQPLRELPSEASAQTALPEPHTEASDMLVDRAAPESKDGEPQRDEGEASSSPANASPVSLLVANSDAKPALALLSEPSATLNRNARDEDAVPEALSVADTPAQKRGDGAAPAVPAAHKGAAIPSPAVEGKQERDHPVKADIEAASGSPVLPPGVETARNASQPVTPLSVRSGQFGHELGVAIARHAALPGEARSEALTVRLDPPEHGRIEIRLSFEEGAPLRASVVASNPATLDLLRRESADLFRALGQAGVGADAQSFQFDSRGQTGGQQKQSPYPFSPMDREKEGDLSALATAPQAPTYRSLRAGGAINLIT